MGFEKVVLDKVAKVLNTDQEAYFFNYTLFVTAPESEARKVFSMLCKEYDWKVQVHKSATSLLTILFDGEQNDN